MQTAFRRVKTVEMKNKDGNFWVEIKAGKLNLMPVTIIELVTKG
jgi:hypothetical protein